MQVLSNNIVGIHQTPFRPHYETWVYHGEPALPPPPPVIDNTRQPLMSDMTALLNDLSYIPPNNEHNEPTQGDIDGRHTTEGEESSKEGVALLSQSFLRLQFLYKSSPHCKDMMMACNCEMIRSPMVLAVDGFNPFGNLSQAYNMWPVILTTYNLPLWLCMKENANVTINDFPARSSLFGWSGQGYKACPTCIKDTPSVRMLSKTAYVGHKRFLKKPHKWRSSREFNGQTDNRDPPKEFGRDEILAQLDSNTSNGRAHSPPWMFPFERYVKKLKGYVRNKAKPKCSIAEGYVAEEALTFILQRHRDNDKRPEVSDNQRVYSLWLVDQWSFQSNKLLRSRRCEIVGQSTEVDAPPDIIDVVDQGDDITDHEDAIPHD
ncbi:hypothetical protein Tco_0844227 [Tanacetum coccineum]